jgi:hypothetical protein
MTIRKNFEVYGYDSVTGSKKTVPVIASDFAAVREQLRKAMPNFVILAIYPDL